MVTLLGAATLAHGAAWHTNGRDQTWAITGVCLFLIGPWTTLVLMEDIDKLRSSSTNQVAETTSRFCRLHHVRTALAAAAFGISLVNLSGLGKK